MRSEKLPRSDVPIYFLEYHRFFDRPHLYGPPGEAYDDNLERFTMLSRGALEISKAIGFLPDVVHAHDWQTALVPVYVNTVEWAQPLHGAATIYTIHNLAYQGVTDGGALFVTGLGQEHYNPDEFEHFAASRKTGQRQHAPRVAPRHGTRRLQHPLRVHRADEADLAPAGHVDGGAHGARHPGKDARFAVGCQRVAEACWP